MGKKFGGIIIEGEEDGAGLTNVKTKAVEIEVEPPKAGKKATASEVKEVKGEPWALPPAGGSPLARVGVSCGLTISIGKYESARPSVFLEMPCPPDAIDAVYEQAVAWVGNRLAEMRQEIEGAVDGDGKKES